MSCRGKSPIRTLESLKGDLDQFEASGGNIKNAKNFNNTIDNVMFNVPLDQVKGLLLSFYTLKINTRISIQNIILFRTIEYRIEAQLNDNATLLTQRLLNKNISLYMVM